MSTGGYGAAGRIWRAVEKRGLSAEVIAAQVAKETGLNPFNAGVMVHEQLRSGQINSLVIAAAVISLLAERRE
jgi:hypothetical protein